MPEPRRHDVMNESGHRASKRELCKPVIAQLNEHSGIGLAVHREGGTVVDMPFTVSPKSDFKRDQGDIDPVDLTLVEQALDVVARQLRQESGTNALAHLKWVLEGVAGDGARKATSLVDAYFGAS